MRIFLYFTFLCLPYVANAAEQVVAVGTDLQAVLDSGADLWLEPGQVYPISKALTFTKPGQRIATLHPKNLSDYATLRIADADLGQLINGNQVDDIIVEKLILDGNRYRLSYLNKLISRKALVFFGGGKAKGQVLRHCVFMAVRTWSTLKVHEGGSDIVVENNIFIGAGADVRGNGREGLENPHVDGFAWGDGISCAAQHTLVRNNVMIDPTDVGLVFFGAPGSVAEGNVIATISRESLGGLNLVDPLKYWAFADDPSLIDYRGVILKDNWIDARGGRIHMAIPVGATPWVPSKEGYTFVGGTITGNLISGDAAAYGIILSGVKDFTVTDNRSTARYSGIAEGLNEKLPPDEPIAFVYNPALVSDSTLQADFKPVERHLKHLLRCNHLPRNTMGYRDYEYGEFEVHAVITTAFEEMLGRKPNAVELAHYSLWLQASKGSADQLRHSLMVMPEFVARHGNVNPHQMQLFRQELWFNAFSGILGTFPEEGVEWVEASELYRSAWAVITQ